MGNIYLAESKRHPGVYAHKDYNPGQIELTRNQNDAKTFDSEKACAEWCGNNDKWQFSPFKFFEPEKPSPKELIEDDED